MAPICLETHITRYHFELDDGRRLTSDEEGEDLCGLEAARKEAVVLVSEVSRWTVPDGNSRTIVSTVRNENGKIVLRATLSLKVEWLF
jgi:hypothetical protein